MSPPPWLADPVDKRPLRALGDTLEAASGRRHPAAHGGWDLRPTDGAGDGVVFEGAAPPAADVAHPHTLALVHARDLLETLPLRRGDRVLVVEGPRGDVLAWLERERGAVGTGVGRSPGWVAAENAAARARRSDAVCVLGDAGALPFADGSFAAVIALGAPDPATPLDRALAEAARVLAPNGRLLLHVPVGDIDGSLDGWRQWRDPADYAHREASAGRYRERMPTRRQVRTRLEAAGFHVLDVRSAEVWVDAWHDRRVVPALARLGRRWGVRGEGAARATRLYARTVVPIVAALASVDQLGSALGIGGSCSFVAEKA